MAVDALARALAAGKVPVDAYDMAVAGGYTGTREQFEEDMGNSGTNATNAANSAAAAAEDAAEIAASAAQIQQNTKDIADIFDDIGLVKITGWSDFNDRQFINLGSTSVTIENGQIVPSTTSTASSKARYVQVSAAPGDKFIVSTTGGGSSRAYGFVSETGSIREKSITNAVLTNQILTAPAQTAYLVINDVVGDAVAYKGDKPDARLDALEAAAANTMRFRSVLTNADDLNNVTTTGIYRCAANSLPTNRPTSGSSIVIVSKAEYSSVTMILQCYYTVSNAYFRVFISGSPDTWYDWIRLRNANDSVMEYIGVLTKQTTEAHPDPDLIDNTTNTGFYRCSSPNVPTDAPENASGVLVVYNSSGINVQIYYTLTSHVYSRTRTGGIWNAWTRSDIDEISAIPVLELTGDTTGMSKKNEVYLKYSVFKSASTYVYKSVPIQKEGSCTVKWQGSSSLRYPKKNFTIKLDEAPDYRNDRTYAVGDYVTYDDNLYMCKTAITEPESWNTEHWTAWVAYTESLVTAGNYSNENKYTVGDMVRYDESLYVCTTAITTPEDWNPAHWTEYSVKKFDAWQRWRMWQYRYRDLHGLASADDIIVPQPNSRWGAQKKFCTKANWIDPSMTRNVVCARLWGQIVKNREDALTEAGQDPDGRNAAPNYGAIDGFPMEIKINGISKGLYTFNIPKDKWTFAMGSGSNADVQYVVGGENNGAAACCWKAGMGVPNWDAVSEYNPEASYAIGTYVYYDDCLYKCKYAISSGGEAWNENHWNALFKVEHRANGVALKNPLSSLDAVIQMIAAAGEGWDENPNILERLDVDSVIDYFIFVCCVNAHDNLARNTLYASYDGTKWYMSAYDLDTTFGSDPYSTSWFDVVNDRNQFDRAAEMNRLAYLVLNYSPAKLKARYQELRAGILSNENVWHELSQFMVDIPTRDYDIDRNIWPDEPGTNTATLAQYMEYYRMHCDYLDKEIEALTV